MINPELREVFTPGDRVKCKRYSCLGTVIHIGLNLVLVEWDSGSQEWINYLELGIVEYSTIKFPFPIGSHIKLASAEAYGKVVSVTLRSNSCEVEWDTGVCEWVNVTTLMPANNIYRKYSI